MTAIGVPSKNSVRHYMSGEIKSDKVRFGTTGDILLHWFTLLEMVNTGHKV